MKGCFITLEGIDGCGKTSIAKRLEREIKKKMGEKVILTSEPWNSDIAKVIMKSKKDNPMADAMLFLADRALHTQWIKDELKKGKVVICDRYHDSTIAYQTAALAKKGIMKPDEAIRHLRSLGAGIATKPDITLLLDITPKIAFGRITKRKMPKTRFEKENYLSEVRKVYLKLAKGEKSRIKVIDASADIETVFEKSLDAIRRRI